MDERLMKVHDAVVGSHIRLGEPVGSRYVWNSFDMGLSPASIRNVMAELEELGLLRKPHTSAGRVPTEKGYRLYVNRLTKTAPVGKTDARSIRKVMNTALSLEEALERVCRSLETLSHQTGIAVLPRPTNGVITGVETARVGRRRLMVTVTVEPGRERTISLRLGSDEADRAAYRLLSRLVRALVGKDLKQAVKALRKMADSEPGLGRWAAPIRSCLAGLLGQAGHGVHVSGAGNLVSALDDATEARSLLEVLESKERIAKLLLPEGHRAGTSVLIGSENRYRPMRSCSVVRSTYGLGDTEGAIGIIGPLRMEYPRFLALVDHVSNELTRFLSGL
jgi:heat-inducible transcriptional repressor